MNQDLFDSLTANTGARYHQFAGTGPYYELVSIACAIGSGNNRIRVTVLDSTGLPAFNVWVRHEFGIEDERFPFTGEAVQFNLGVGSHYSEPEPPPDHILIEGGASDQVWVGNANIIGFQHTEWSMTFKKSAVPEPPEPPKPKTLEEAIAQATAKQVLLPINDQAALYKAAQKHGWTYPQSDEFEVSFMGQVFVCQVYNAPKPPFGGTIYCPKGYFDDVMFLEKTPT